LQSIPIRPRFADIVGKTRIICGFGIDEDGRPLSDVEASISVDRVFIKKRIMSLMVGDPGNDTELQYQRHFVESLDVYAPCSILDKITILDAPGTAIYAANGQAPLIICHLLCLM